MTRPALKLILFLFFATLIAAADTSLPGDPFIDPNVRSPSNFWYTRNALSLYHEQFFGDHELYLWAYPSTVTADPKIWAPRFAYRWKDRLWLDVGTQKDDTDPYISPLTINGARVDYDLDPFRLDASVGETTQDFLPRILQGQPEFSFNQVALTRRLGDTGWGRLSTSGWQPLDGGKAIYPNYRPPEASRVVSAELAPDLTENFRDLRVRAGYGLELMDPTGSLAADRRAYNWSLNWHRPSVRLDARQSHQGLAYGPAHFENFLRGQSSLNVSTSVDILPTLVWRESFDRFVFSQPLESGTRRSSANDTYSHELFYQPSQDVNASLLFSSSSNLINPIATTVETDRAQLRANWDVTQRLRLGLTYYNVDSASQSQKTNSVRSDLRADWWLDGRNRVTALIGRSRVQGPSLVNEGLDLGFGYEYLFGDDLGRARLDYRRSRFGFSQQTYQSYQAALSFYPDPRWKIRGSCAIFDTGVESRTSATVDMSYLLNEHQEVGLVFEQRPFLLYPDLPDLNLGQTSVGLQLRQSFGGPLQASFARRLQPELKIQVLTQSPEDPSLTAPLQGAKLRVDDEAVATTGVNGKAKARVSRGKHSLTLDLSDVGPHFVMNEEPEKEVDLGAADRVSLRYKVLAYSGIRLVTWNDFLGEGSLPVGYIPVGSVPLLLDGLPQETDENGVLLTTRLLPGLHTVTVQTDLLAPGIEAIGPKEFEVETQPGQEVLLTIPLRGFAQIQGQVALEGGLSVPSQGLSIMANEREIGRTDSEGRFTVKAPIGNVKLGVNTAELGTRAFLPDGPVSLLLEPGQTRVQDLRVSRTAQLMVKFTSSQPSTLKFEGVPITLEGNEFRYSDSEGQAVFTGLKPGLYELKLDPQYFPEGYRPVGETVRSLKLSPGEDRELIVEVKKSER